MAVAYLPRDPFLAHSERLLRFLADRRDGVSRILEIGCGPASPLVGMVTPLFPTAALHQIDALPEIVAAAATHCPQAQVDVMRADDMSPIQSGSKDVVVAMSVFDQNADSALPKIASEMHRVLDEQGQFLYIHNEQLNLPATAASLMDSASVLLLPNDRWQPANHLEYCSADARSLIGVLPRLGMEGEPIQAYLRAIYPYLFGDGSQASETGKIDVPFLIAADYPAMQRIRKAVNNLRSRGLVELRDHRTVDLLRSRIEATLLGNAHQWSIRSAGLFEIRIHVPWKNLFRQRPTDRYFLRGISQFGASTVAEPARMTDHDQTLSDSSDPGADDLTLIAYQYGLVADRVSVV